MKLRPLAFRSLVLALVIIGVGIAVSFEARPGAKTPQEHARASPPAAPESVELSAGGGSTGPNFAGIANRESTSEQAEQRRVQVERSQMRRKTNRLIRKMERACGPLLQSREQMLAVAEGPTEEIVASSKRLHLGQSDRETEYAAQLEAWKALVRKLANLANAGTRPPQCLAFLSRLEQ